MEFDDFIEQVAVADPELQNKIRLARGFNEQGEPLTRIVQQGAEYASARADLAALTKVFDDAMAGRPISTEDMPDWISDFFGSSEGKSAVAQVNPEFSEVTDPTARMMPSPPPGGEEGATAAEVAGPLAIFGQIPLTPEQRQQVDIMVRALALGASGHVANPGKLTSQHIQIFVDNWLDAYEADESTDDWFGASPEMLVELLMANYVEQFYDKSAGTWATSVSEREDLGLDDNAVFERALGVQGRTTEDGLTVSYIPSTEIIEKTTADYGREGIYAPAARERPPNSTDIFEALQKASRGIFVSADGRTIKEGTRELFESIVGRIEIAMYWAGEERFETMDNNELFEEMGKYVDAEIEAIKAQGVDAALAEAFDESQTASQLENSAVSKHIKGMELRPGQVSLMDTPEMRAKVIKAWQDSGSALEIEDWLGVDGNAAVLEELDEVGARVRGEDTAKGRRDIFIGRISRPESEGGLGINIANRDAKNIAEQLLEKAEEAWESERAAGGTRSLDEVQDEFIQAMPSQEEIDRQIESRFGALPPGLEEGQTAATARYDALKARVAAGEDVTAQEILDASDPIQGIADAAMARLDERIGGAREVRLPEGHVFPDIGMGRTLEERTVGPGGQRAFESTIPERTPEQNEQLEAELAAAQEAGDVEQAKLIQADIDAPAKMQAELEKDRNVASALKADAALANAFATGSKAALDAAIKASNTEIDADALVAAQGRQFPSEPLYDISKTPGAADKFAVASAGASSAYLEEQERRRQREAQRAAARASRAQADATPRRLGGKLGA